MSHKIIYHVPMVAQPSSKTCWFACLQMVLAWHGRNRHALRGHGLDDALRNVAATNEGLPKAGIGELAAYVGLQVRIGSAPNLREVEQLLTLHGPLWYGGHCTGWQNVNSASHVVVITGVQSGWITINDPWPIGQGDETSYEYDDFASKLSCFGMMYQ